MSSARTSGPAASIERLVLAVPWRLEEHGLLLLSAVYVVTDIMPESYHILYRGYILLVFKILGGI